MRVAGIALALVCAACPSSEDQEARKRVFSPDEPPRALAQARDPLPFGAQPPEPDTVRRLLRMPREEAAARLGAHRYRADVTFRWTRGDRAVALAEEHEYAEGPKGDFRLRMDNEKSLGLEMVFHGGTAYVRSRFGTFRPRRTDRADHMRWREEATGAVRTFYDLFSGWIRLEPVGEDTHEGRRVLAYRVSLDPGRAPPAEEEKRLPPVVYPRGGPDNDTRLRLEFHEKRRPVRASGEVWVDAESSALVKADLAGRLDMPPHAPADPPALLDVTVTALVAGIGKDPGIKAPAASELPPAPHAVKDPLKFLEGERPAAAAPAEAPEEPEEPETPRKPE
jgi:hypothetical protein